jgi:ubiquitin-conjugating enzyme (huntingtin interacting protein 2)
MAMADARIQKEYKELLEQTQLPTAEVVEVIQVLNKLRHWKGKIKGPIDSPYEGGVFTVDIQFPKDYPFNPPKMKFDTKVWHPNVSSKTGCICLDILKEQWTPALTIRTALLSVQVLLTAAEPDDPQDGEVATMYKADRSLYEYTAK